MDSTRDPIWFKLADAYRMSATKQTDPAEKQKRMETAVADYQSVLQRLDTPTPRFCLPSNVKLGVLRQVVLGD